MQYLVVATRSVPKFCQTIHLNKVIHNLYVICTWLFPLCGTKYHSVVHYLYIFKYVDINTYLGHDIKSPFNIKEEARNGTEKYDDDSIQMI